MSIVASLHRRLLAPDSAKANIGADTGFRPCGELTGRTAANWAIARASKTVWNMAAMLGIHAIAPRQKIARQPPGRKE
jgi:hypothetical protein